MNELKKTTIFAGAAVVLLILAFVTAPRHVTPNAFLDQGEPFFPAFTDPNEATTLNVVETNKETGQTVPFEVTFKNGLWTIPSHHDYPADGKDRLAKTAAAIIELKKDDFRSDNAADQQACGVLDPMDESSTGLEGRGKRVTIRGKNNQVLADIIIGNEVPGRSGFRFVRLPDQKRIYAAQFKDEISTKFKDWIETDLLQVTQSEIAEIKLKDYSINERTRRVENRDVIDLVKKDGAWKIDKLGSNQELNTAKVTTLLSTLDALSIVGVRPKPAGLSESLTQESEGISITQEDVLSLQSKGYYFAQNGSLLSNEGELQAKTTDGVEYTLRFGEVVYGTGLAVSAGADDEDADGKKGENRYLFITTRFDKSQFPEPKSPSNTAFLSKSDSLWTEADRENRALYDAHEEWRKKVEKGQHRSDELNARFAKWYYVIPADSYEKLRLTRSDLVKAKAKTS